jgi:hypothetical protein
MMFLGLAWTFAKYTAWPVVSGIAKAIPPKVWIGLAVVAAIWYYGHWKEKQGRLECEAAVRVATQKEVARVKEVNSKVTQGLLARALEAEERNRRLAKEVDDAVKDVGVSTKGKSDVVCLPGTFLDRVRPSR